MRCALENYADCKDAIMALALEHWREVEWEPERMPLNVNQEAYLKADQAGGLCTIVARDDDDSIAGYAMWGVFENPKHIGTLMASNEVLYVRPDMRGHMLGPRLIGISEGILRAVGVKAIGICVKNKADYSPMLARVGFEPVETVWLKWIGDSDTAGVA